MTQDPLLAANNNLQALIHQVGILSEGMTEIKLMLTVKETLLCFTVEGASSKLGFQVHKPVNQLVNQSMSQNAASSTSSETIGVR